MNFLEKAILKLKAAFWDSSFRVMGVCVFVILAVSLFDTYLVYVFRDSILIDERNPVCLELIKMDPGGLTWFYLGKFLGNFVVVSALLAMAGLGFRRHREISIGVAGCQIMLLIYLCFADQMTAFLCFDGLWSENPYLQDVAIKSITIQAIVFVVLLGFVYWFTGVVSRACQTSASLRAIQNIRPTQDA